MGMIVFFIGLGMLLASLAMIPKKEGERMKYIVLGAVGVLLIWGSFFDPKWVAQTQIVRNSLLEVKNLFFQGLRGEVGVGI